MVEQHQNHFDQQQKNGLQGRQYVQFDVDKVGESHCYHLDNHDDDDDTLNDEQNELKRSIVSPDSCQLPQAFEKTRKSNLSQINYQLQQAELKVFKDTNSDLGKSNPQRQKQYNRDSSLAPELRKSDELKPQFASPSSQPNMNASMVEYQRMLAMDNIRHTDFKMERKDQLKTDVVQGFLCQRDSVPQSTKGGHQQSLNSSSPHKSHRKTCKKKRASEIQPMMQIQQIFSPQTKKLFKKSPKRTDRSPDIVPQTSQTSKCMSKPVSQPVEVVEQPDEDLGENLQDDFTPPFNNIDPACPGSVQLFRSDHGEQYANSNWELPNKNIGESKSSHANKALRPKRRIQQQRIEQLAHMANISSAELLHLQTIGQSNEVPNSQELYLETLTAREIVEQEHFIKKDVDERLHTGKHIEEELNRRNQVSSLRTKANSEYFENAGVGMPYGDLDEHGGQQENDFERFIQIRRTIDPTSQNNNYSNSNGIKSLSKSNKTYSKKIGNKIGTSKTPALTGSQPRTTPFMSDPIPQNLQNTNNFPDFNPLSQQQQFLQVPRATTLYQADTQRSKSVSKNEQKQQYYQTQEQTQHMNHLPEDTTPPSTDYNQLLMVCNSSVQQQLNGCRNHQQGANASRQQPYSTFTKKSLSISATTMPLQSNNLQRLGNQSNEDLSMSLHLNTKNGDPKQQDFGKIPQLKQQVSTHLDHTGGDYQDSLGQQYGGGGNLMSLKVGQQMRGFHTNMGNNNQLMYLQKDREESQESFDTRAYYGKGDHNLSSHSNKKRDHVNKSTIIQRSAGSNHFITSMAQINKTSSKVKRKTSEPASQLIDSDALNPVNDYQINQMPNKDLYFNNGNKSNLKQMSRSGKLKGRNQTTMAGLMEQHQRTNSSLVKGTIDQIKSSIHEYWMGGSQLKRPGPSNQTKINNQTGVSTLAYQSSNTVVMNYTTTNIISPPQISQTPVHSHLLQTTQTQPSRRADHSMPDKSVLQLADESSLYKETEANPDYFDNKLHPTKIVERDWQHSYKLSQLIQMQQRMFEQVFENNSDCGSELCTVAQFGGVSQDKLDAAFEMVKTRSTTTGGYRSPSRGLPPSTRSRMTCELTQTTNRNNLLFQQRSTALSGRGSRFASTQEGIRVDKGQQKGLMINVDNEQNTLDSNQPMDQLSDGGTSLISDQSEHFVKTSIKIRDRTFQTTQEPNLLIERIKEKKFDRTLASTRSITTEINHTSENTQQFNRGSQRGELNGAQVMSKTPVIRPGVMITTDSDPMHVTLESGTIQNIVRVSQAQTNERGDIVEKVEDQQQKYEIPNLLDQTQQDDKKVQFPQHHQNSKALLIQDLQTIQQAQSTQEEQKPDQDIQKDDNIALNPQRSKNSQQNNQLLNSSKFCDSDYFVLSNTSVSQVNQSHVVDNLMNNLNLDDVDASLQGSQFSSLAASKFKNSLVQQPIEGSNSENSSKPSHVRGRSYGLKSKIDVHQLNKANANEILLDNFEMTEEADQDYGSQGTDEDIFNLKASDHQNIQVINPTVQTPAKHFQQASFSIYKNQQQQLLQSQPNRVKSTTQYSKCTKSNNVVAQFTGSQLTSALQMPEIMGISKIKQSASTDGLHKQLIKPKQNKTAGQTLTAPQAYISQVSNLKQGRMAVVQGDSIRNISQDETCARNTQPYFQKKILKHSNTTSGSQLISFDSSQMKHNFNQRNKQTSSSQIGSNVGGGSGAFIVANPVEKQKFYSLASAGHPTKNLLGDKKVMSQSALMSQSRKQSVSGLRQGQNLIGSKPTKLQQSTGRGFNPSLRAGARTTVNKSVSSVTSQTAIMPKTPNQQKSSLQKISSARRKMQPNESLDSLLLSGYQASNATLQTKHNFTNNLIQKQHRLQQTKKGPNSSSVAKLLDNPPQHHLQGAMVSLIQQREMPTLQHQPQLIKKKIRKQSFGSPEQMMMISTISSQIMPQQSVQLNSQGSSGISQHQVQNTKLSLTKSSKPGAMISAISYSGSHQYGASLNPPPPAPQIVMSSVNTNTNTQTILK